MKTNLPEKTPPKPRAKEHIDLSKMPKTFPMWDENLAAKHKAEDEEAKRNPPTLVVWPE